MISATVTQPMATRQMATIPTVPRPIASKPGSPIDWDTLMDGYTTGYATVASDNDHDNDADVESAYEGEYNRLGGRNMAAGSARSSARSSARCSARNSARSSAGSSAGSVRRARRRRPMSRKIGAARGAARGEEAEEPAGGGQSPKLQVLLLQLEAAESASRAAAGRRSRAIDGSGSRAIDGSAHSEHREHGARQAVSPLVLSPAVEVHRARILPSSHRRGARSSGEKTGGYSRKLAAGAPTDITNTPESNAASGFKHHGSTFSIGSGSERVRQRPSTLVGISDRRKGFAPPARRSLELGEGVEV
jgi:hypothetical protein